MKVLMLSWEYPPRIVGGISRVVHDLAQKLGEKGTEVHVVTFRDSDIKELEKDKNVIVHRVNTCDVNTTNFIDWVLQLNFAFVEYSTKLINEIGSFDIIHAHDWVVAFAARTLKNSFSIPLVSTIHATEHGRNWGIHNGTQRYISSVEWWLCYESWRVIVNSDYMQNEVKSVFNLPEDKIDVIYNGVDLDKFKDYQRNYDFRRNYASDNEKIVFFVGRLVNEKGVHVLLDSIPKILSHYNDVKFVIAGSGPQIDYLKWKTWDMNIPHKVYFAGYLSEENLLNLYKASDIAVVPSLYEPFGIVALESMVAGVPVVVSDTGGLSGIVEHCVDGMKCYTGNANSLADSILYLLHNSDKAKEISKRAYDKVCIKYNWDIISDKTMQVYTKVIEQAKDWHPVDLKAALNSL